MKEECEVLMFMDKTKELFNLIDNLAETNTKILEYGLELAKLSNNILSLLNDRCNK